MPRAIWLARMLRNVSVQASKAIASRLSSASTPTNRSPTRSGSASWACASGKPRQGDLRRGLGLPGVLQLGADGAPVAQLRSDPGHPHRTLASRHRADQPLAERHLRPHSARAVPVARGGDQMSAVVGEQHHGVVKPELVVERLEHVLQQHLEAAGLVHPVGDGPEAAQLAGHRVEDARRGLGRIETWVGRKEEACQLLDRQDLVHVGAAELEDAQHPGVGGDDLEPGRHLLEERPLALRVIEPQLQLVQLVGDRREHLDRWRAGSPGRCAGSC